MIQQCTVIKMIKLMNASLTQNRKIFLKHKRKMLHLISASSSINIYQLMNSEPHIDQKALLLGHFFQNDLFIDSNQPQISLAQNKQDLQNKENQNLKYLEDYFSKKKFKCIYNRIQTYKDSKSFQGRLKGVDSLVDYNWKSFKDLQQQPKQAIEQSMDRIDADFESGNICRAYVNSEEEKEFYLLIENDLNTYGYNNWFFYRIKNAKAGLRKFTIVNLIKKTYFFSQGMLISIFSVKKNRQQSIICRLKDQSWFKGGNKITFGTINLARNHHSGQNYHFLSFEYEFDFENDEVYFALNQPYTYSRLKTFIEQVKDQPKSICMEIKTIGYSISNNIIPALKFTKPSQKSKDIILILARQHPCQTVGSFIAEKMINHLLESNPINNFLLSTFDFIFIPMVNADGVIHGSSRCNMAGFDLNRQWGDNIIKQLTPETAKIKQFIINLTKSQKIKYMIDLHGHGKKLNSFFFSCKDTEKEDVKLLATIMRKLQPRFSIDGCTYGITKDKENTIRSTINGMGIAHSYTLQTSLFGWRDEKNQIRHFNQEDYSEIAKSLLNSLFIIEADPASTITQLGFTKSGIVAQMEKAVDKSAKEQEANFDDNDILSDSDPEGDKLDAKDLLCKCQNKALKKKIQQQFNRSKKEKGKKSKTVALDGSGSKSYKNIRRACPSAMNIRPKMSANNYVCQSKESLNKTELRLNSCNKISLSQKWKQRRKQIEKKKNEQQKQLQNDINQRMNYTKIEKRQRFKTEVNVVRPFKAHLPHSSFLNNSHLSKTRHFTQKLKTQFKEVQDFTYPSEEQIIQNEARKSALQTKFKELQQQSLNVMLIDTLSILKIAPNEKHISPDIKETKNLKPQLSKKEYRAAQSPVNESPAKAQLSQITHNGDKESVRYKKFKQFLTGSPVKKKQGNGNSVLYYFPLL